MAQSIRSDFCRLARRRVLLLVAALTLTGCGSSKTELPPQSFLPAPSGLRIQNSPSSVQLSWDAVAGASFYRIYWAQASTVTTATGNMLKSLSTTVLQSGLQEGATYAYVVVAVDERDREGQPSLVITTTLGFTPHDAPQNVRAIAGDAQVTIDWDRTPGASGYRVSVASSFGTSTVVQEGNDPSEPPIVHQKLLNRTTYTYTVRAKFGEQLGPPSLPVEATPMPTQPGVPVIIDVQIRTVAGFNAGGVASHGVISLTWTKPDHAKNYQVYAKRNQEAEIPLIPEDHPLTATSFDHEVDYEAVYEYRVEAFNEGVPSGTLDPPGPPVRASVPLPLFNNSPYYYVVRTADSSGELSASSSEASAVPRENVILTPPTAVNVSDTPRDLGKSLTITWIPSTTRGVKAQALYRSESSAPGTFTPVQTFSDSTTSSFADTTVEDGKQYFYALTALAGDLESDLSAAASAVAFSNSDLVPPTGLTVSDTPDDAGGSLTITWVPSTAHDVTAQRLYRSTNDGGPYDVITNLTNPLQDRFPDDTVSTGTAYYYTIRALRGTEQSALSNQAVGIAVGESEPFPPRSLQAIDVPADLGGAIDLSWTPSASTVSDLVTEHRLYRSTSSGGPYQLVATFKDEVPTSYRDFGVPSVPSATGLVVVPDGSNLLITWSPVAVAGDGYRLYWWEEDSLGAIQSSGTVADIITERFVHSGLTSGAHYVYAVQVQGYPAVSFPVEADAP